MSGDRIIPVPPISFGVEGIKERGDLQRLLRDQIEAIVPGGMVLAEEFRNWDDSNRRIDLLCLDSDGTLVVVELKRSEDGGFMDLQALRYAAMVSSMTFDQAVAAHQHYLSTRGREGSAREHIVAHLEGDGLENFGKDVRIVLASADFSKELTTTVIWLYQQHDLDICCFRIRLHRLDDRRLLDVQQIIPPPETADYQIKVREKLQQERIVRQQGRDFTRYDVTANGETFLNQSKRMAAYHAFRAIISAGTQPEDVAKTIQKGQMVVSADGFLSGMDFCKALTAQQMTQDKISRYFTEDEELIHTANRTYAITKMWGGDVETEVNKVLSLFPAEGVSCVRSASDALEV